jgi:hypothetical protein
VGPRARVTYPVDTDDNTLLCIFIDQIKLNFHINESASLRIQGHLVLVFVNIVGNMHEPMASCVCFRFSSDLVRSNVVYINNDM